MSSIGKTALVTGGSRGLGREIARLLADQGCRVTIVGRDPASLDDAIHSFAGHDHARWQLDLSQPHDTHELLRRMAVAPFELAVNNAGATRFGAFSDLPPVLVEEIIWLNFTAPALISRQFLESAPAGATLVNVTSIVATVPMPGNTLYSSAKAAMKALSEGLWFEARARGVHVLEFRPVSLRTGFHANAGRASLAQDNVATDPAAAAQDLLRTLGKRHGLAHGSGLPGWVLDAMNRTLPRRLMVSMLGRKATRSGYLT